MEGHSRMVVEHFMGFPAPKAVKLERQLVVVVLERACFFRIMEQVVLFVSSGNLSFF
jgi:hypothetical protein